MAAHKRPWLGPILFVLVVVGAVVMIGLGVWQLQRLGERRALNAQIRARMAQPPADLAHQSGGLPEYTPVLAKGVYDFANEIVLRNRAHDQEPGVHVLTPLRWRAAIRRCWSTAAGSPISRPTPRHAPPMMARQHP